MVEGEANWTGNAGFHTEKWCASVYSLCHEAPHRSDQAKYLLFADLCKPMGHKKTQTSDGR